MAVRTPQERLRCTLPALGLACALGVSRDEVRARMLAGDSTRLTRRADLIAGDSRLFGEVCEQLPLVPPRLAAYDCRNSRLASIALAGIRDELEKATSRFGPQRIGVVVGSSTSGIAEAEKAFQGRLTTGTLPARFHMRQLEFGGVSEFVAEVTGAAGPRYAISTACSAGAKALVAARSLLDAGVCDAVVAGGVDSLCRLTANGFAALQALAKDATNPMSRNRDGITLGEAAALFLVTRDGEGIELLGAGESSDAHHMSAPDPQGRGAESAMRGALDDAGLAPEAISYLNLHGTGTPQNDSVEAAAVARVFPRGVPCSSTKPLTGHALGASGAIEAAFCWLLLAGRGDQLALPPHCWDGVRDPELPTLALVESPTRIDVAPGSAALLSSSFGFGGNNCALVLGDAR